MPLKSPQNLALIISCVRRAQFVVLHQSMPPGIPTHSKARLIVATCCLNQVYLRSLGSFCVFVPLHSGFFGSLVRLLRLLLSVLRLLLSLLFDLLHLLLSLLFSVLQCPLNPLLFLFLLFMSKLCPCCIEVVPEHYSGLPFS
ncbi:hypothetical protein EJ08DRAFT_355599 [Tothia fuscella]|uniref:Uncharacterized protein n=1 Tax=Tothia fuscella TaxID=1048955 RepID=A0A9P4TWP6_9PEZI|nr:hypothetical protein EJ08DRAFT_355599 [Tothia fuscella]